MQTNHILSVIVVVYSEYEVLDRCLTVLKTELPTGSELILVHNNSGKPGIDEVLSKHPEAKYVFSSKNLGFGKAVNLGAQHAVSRFLLVITPDILVQPGTILPTLAYLAQRPRVGLVTCPLLGARGEKLRSTFTGFPNMFSHIYELNWPIYKLIHRFAPNYIPHLHSQSILSTIHYPDHIVGAYLLLRKTAFDQIGGFSPEYFLYREETDLCWRLGRAGWGIVYLPVGGVTHTADGAVHQSLSQSSPHYLASTYIFFSRYYSPLYATIAWWIGLLSSWCSALTFQFLSIVSHSANKHAKYHNQLLQWQSILDFHVENIHTHFNK